MPQLATLVSVIASAVATLGAIFGVFLWLQKRFREVEREIEAVRRDLKDLARRLDLIRVQADYHGHQLRGLFRATTGVIGVLARVPGVQTAELTRMVAGTLEPPDIDKTIRELTSGNPFTVEEADRLRLYYAKAHRGEPFTEQQARDFYVLSQRATEEKPASDAVWTLFLIASVFFVLYALSPQE